MQLRVCVFSHTSRRNDLRTKDDMTYYIHNIHVHDAQLNIHVYSIFMSTSNKSIYERWGAGVEYHFQEI